MAERVAVLIVAPRSWKALKWGSRGRMPKVQPPGKSSKETLRNLPRSGPHRSEVARMLARFDCESKSGLSSELSMVSVFWDLSQLI